MFLKEIVFLTNSWKFQDSKMCPLREIFIWNLFLSCFVARGTAQAHLPRGSITLSDSVISLLQLQSSFWWRARGGVRIANDFRGIGVKCIEADTTHWRLMRYCQWEDRFCDFHWKNLLRSSTIKNFEFPFAFHWTHIASKNWSPFLSPLDVKAPLEFAPLGVIHCSTVVAKYSEMRN